MVDLSKIKKEIVAFIVFLILVILWGLFTNSPVNTTTPDPQSQAGGMDIQFKDGTSEPEVKVILQNINMTMNYSLEYDASTMAERYYIMVDKDKIMGLRDESRKVKNWTEYSPTILKKVIII